MTNQGRKINVSLRVIADLSQGLYRSPADALKELMNNAYDADSPYVNINFSRDFSSITVEDFGEGITIDDFVAVMETIGGSSKRSADTGYKEYTESGRKIIGRIGIGLLSVSQIAGELEFTSTQKGSNEGFSAKVEFDQFASEEARKVKITDLYEGDDKIDIGRYLINKIEGVVREKSGTTLKLSKLNRVINNKLISFDKKTEYNRTIGTKFNNAKDFFVWMFNERVTKKALHEFDRIFWELCVLCPVPYFERPIIVYNQIEGTNVTTDLSRFAKKANKETNFDIYYNGVQCFKPVQFPQANDVDYPLFFNLLFMKGLDGGKVSYKDYEKGKAKPITKNLNIHGYFYFHRPRIWPPEMQGMLIRVRNVAVGLYDQSLLTYPYHEGYKFSQVTGEIFVDGLDLSLNIDRASFRETDPAFVAFQQAIHTYLNKTVFPRIKEYARIDRGNRSEQAVEYEYDLLQQNFGVLDSDRKIQLGGNQNNLIERDGKKITIATSLRGKKLRFNKEFHRTVAFLEAKLTKKLNEHERDNLFDFLTQWLNDFDS